MVYQDQGILVEHDTFSENISSILDNQYRLQHNVIDINAKIWIVRIIHWIMYCH